MRPLLANLYLLYPNVLWEPLKTKQWTLFWLPGRPFIRPWSTASLKLRKPWRNTLMQNTKMTSLRLDNGFTSNFARIAWDQLQVLLTISLPSVSMVLSRLQNVLERLNIIFNYQRTQRYIQFSTIHYCVHIMVHSHLIRTPCHLMLWTTNLYYSHCPFYHPKWTQPLTLLHPWC